MTCWPCNLGNHPAQPHTWTAAEDLEREGLPVPTSPEEWARYVADRPCGCYCAGGVAS